MKKAGWILGSIALICVVIVGVLFVLFWWSMKPNSKEVTKTKEMAVPYIQNTFGKEAEIFDVLYDNMGNFSQFTYAANVRHKDGTDFLVYRNEETNQIENTYVKEKWEDDIDRQVRPYLEKTFEVLEDVWVMYDDDVGKEQSVHAPASYTSSQAGPRIWAFIPRKAKDGDDELLKKFEQFLQKDVLLTHASVTISYNNKGVPLEETELRTHY